MIRPASIARAIPYAVIAAVAGYFYMLAGRLEFDEQAGRLGPDAWPKGMLGLMIAVALAGVLKALFAKPADIGHDPVADLRAAERMAGDDEPALPKWLHLPILGSVLFAIYIPVLEFTGFVIATSALMISFQYLGRYRNHPVIWISSIAGPLLFFLVFRTVAYISLPLGKGPFLDFSVWLMRLLGMA